MRSRIIFGVTAWLLGAATATTGSLLTVSLLGLGITGSSAQLLTQDAVNRALASEAAQGPGSGGPPASPAVTAAGAPASSQPAATSPVTTSASPAPTSATTAASPPAPPSSPPPPPSSGSAVLTSSGGEVVATCQDADAYLISWSPLQGYQVGTVIRGPALAARVTFESHADRVTMTVSCSAGVPSATSRSWVGDE